MNIAADYYAVMANPVGHSKSPLIHSIFANQTGEKLRYDALLAELDDFETDVSKFFENKGKGLNISLPFKQRAWKLAGQLTDSARLAGAVNTLWKDDQGQLWGDTTDGVGMVRDITLNHRIPMFGKRILVLGAGGAVRGVLEPILAEGPAEIVIANRTLSRAEELVELFGDFGTLSSCPFAEIGGAFDLIINGTAASLQGDVPPLPESVIGKQTAVYDLMYGPQETAFNTWARELGAARVMDGLGMLVEQAAETFFIWRGVRPQTASVIDEIRAGF